MIFKIQVVKDSGDKLSFFEGAFRDTLGKIISSLIFGIGFLMAFFRQDAHALHDLIFNTKVIAKD